MTLGAELKRLRESAGLTQDVLAERLGITQGFIANLEAGRKSIKTTNLLYKLCDALGVSCDHFRPFLTDGEAPPAPPAEPDVKPKKGKKK